VALRSALALDGFVAVAFAPALIGGQFMPGEWYESLRKPAWNPPAWIFAPVWTALYVLIGMSGWLVWREVWGRNAKVQVAGRAALGLFGIQLVLNGAWSWIFFGLHRPGVAFAEILMLWAAIVATLVAFWRVRPLAGALLLPYLAWVSFAAVLNGTLWLLNR
jgi:benzodiazapine receptor